MDNQTIKEAIQQHPLSMADAAKAAGLPFGTFKYRAQKLGLYSPNQNHRGRKLPNKGPKAFDLEDVLVENSSYARCLVKKRIIEAGLLDHTTCAECGQKDIWNGKTLVMHLDHTNGVNNDHRLENLRFLCPNCHTQTPTYCRKG